MENIQELTLERFGLVTEFSAICGTSVLIQQTGSVIGLTLDQLIEAGRWAERIKSEEGAEWQGNSHQKPPMSEKQKATLLDVGTLAEVDPYACLNPMSRGVSIKSDSIADHPHSPQDFPPIPEGWERFTTLEEWRGGEWKCWQPYCEAWSKAQNVTGLGLSASRLPKMAVAQYYIQRVKE